MPSHSPNSSKCTCTWIQHLYCPTCFNTDCNNFGRDLLNFFVIIYIMSWPSLNKGKIIPTAKFMEVDKLHQLFIKIHLNWSRFIKIRQDPTFKISLKFVITYTQRCILLLYCWWCHDISTFWDLKSPELSFPATCIYSGKAFQLKNTSMFHFHGFQPVSKDSYMSLCYSRCNQISW